jgi:hypothetical protein
MRQARASFTSSRPPFVVRTKASKMGLGTMTILQHHAIVCRGVDAVAAISGSSVSMIERLPTAPDPSPHRCPLPFMRG